jgi:hypothetical protein
MKKADRVECRAQEGELAKFLSKNRSASLQGKGKTREQRPRSTIGRIFERSVAVVRRRCLNLSQQLVLQQVASHRVSRQKNSSAVVLWKCQTAQSVREKHRRAAGYFCLTPGMATRGLCRCQQWLIVLVA